MVYGYMVIWLYGYMDRVYNNHLTITPSISKRSSAHGTCPFSPPFQTLSVKHMFAT